MTEYKLVSKHICSHRQIRQYQENFKRTVLFSNARYEYKTITRFTHKHSCIYMAITVATSVNLLFKNNEKLCLKNFTNLQEAKNLTANRKYYQKSFCIFLSSLQTPNFLNVWMLFLWGKYCHTFITCLMTFCCKILLNIDIRKFGKKYKKYYISQEMSNFLKFKIRIRKLHFLQLHVIQREVRQKDVEFT